MFRHHGKCEPIYKIFNPVKNMRAVGLYDYKDTHLTWSALLHYSVIV